MRARSLIHPRSAALSAVILLCILWSGCQTAPPSAGAIVGTWERHHEMYRRVITYHSDGTWVMTLVVLPPPEKTEEKSASTPLLRGLVQSLAAGTPFSCSGTWRVVDGRLVTVVTASAVSEIAVGSVTSEEIVRVKETALELRSQVGDSLMWRRITYPVASTQPTSSSLERAGS